MLIRTSKTCLLILTTFALLVSAISACACSHHEIAAVENNSSCHSSAHGTPVAQSEQPTPSGDSLRVDCDCLVRLPIPAISAKTEKRSFNTVEDNEQIAFMPVRFELNYTRTLGIPDFHFSPDHHSPPELFSGPSRAPPRL
ncbi:hypothetical protein [Leptolyngbya sp. 7M]|uniref:hypothetical protein n=1 Tax=Leptolyngbya sp. 7M TaxID=2812896 RepID=UPI001B8CB608|nr:hypothetical protein [Leptolyngbya sp. 7M]QYO68293.1 hypothetical protein JVX88_16900 [Leptolyngbya sp. 7M]